MLELLKTLVDEPGKQRKYVIFAIRFILCSIVTSNIYEYYFGKYYLITFDDDFLWENLFYFFISGKAILVAFLYLLLNFLLFDLLSLVPQVLLQIWKKDNKGLAATLDDGYLLYCLRKYDVVRNIEGKRNLAIGSNFEGFYKGLARLKDDEFRAEVSNVEHSLLFEIVSTYFVFGIVFYLFTDIDLPLVLDVALVIGFFIFALVYLFICRLVNYLLANLDDILLQLSIVKSEDLIDKTLTAYNVDFLIYRGMANYSFARKVKSGNQSFLIHFYSHRLDIPSKFIEECLKFNLKEPETEIFLVSRSPLTDRARLLLEQNEGAVHFLFFSTEEELMEILKENFYDSKPHDVPGIL